MAPAFWRETLDSIKSQTLRPHEVVVVDDFSSDASASIAQAHPAVTRVLRSETNSGVCHARNLGIAATTGSLIAFCDQDDLWVPGKLEAQAAAFACCPDIDFLFTNFRHLRGVKVELAAKLDQAPPGWWREAAQIWNGNAGDGNVVEGEVLALLVHPALPHLLRFQPAFPSTIMIRRSLLERSGPFDESLGREQSEDLEFLMRCDLVCRIGVLTESLVTIRKHDANYSTDNTKTTMSQIRILAAMASPGGRYDAFASQIREQIGKRSVDVIDGAFASGDLATCRNLVGNFPRRWPWKQRIKIAVASLPHPLAIKVQSAMVRRDG